MNYAIRVEQVVTHPIAVVRRRAAPKELPKVIPEACGLVWKVVKAAGVADAGRHVAVYRDGLGDEFDVEVGVEVGSAFAGRDEVFGSVTPGGEVAGVTHFGPYNQLEAVHRAIENWCAAQGRKPLGIGWEIYGHWLEEWNKDPSKIRTDVFWLLRR